MLRIHAIKSASDLTLKQRLDTVLFRQKEISSLLGIWEWFLGYKEKADLRSNSSIEMVYKKLKEGLNAKRAKIIRYKPDDVADTQSHCFFYHGWGDESLFIRHGLGYYGKFQKYESIDIKNLELYQETNNKDGVIKLINKLIEIMDPLLLYVTTDKYYREYSIAVNSNVPKSGWMTYLNGKIKLPLSKPPGVDMLKYENGVLFTTVNEVFDESIKEHLEKALLLENWFAENPIDLGSHN